ncbi:MAG TPA: DUF554 domain-containing protein [Candidatus Dormibacteraeota bacterium]|nr:DUF554 domain-containing protein [Candidatus Dormibacteraeota bacterium]
MIPGLGTALNTGTVLAGTAVGLTLGRVIPESLQRTIRAAIGLFVAVIGIQMALKTHSPLILLVSVLLGVLIGELLRLDDGVQAIGAWAERRVSRGGEPGRVRLAFITTSLIFCVGPLTVLGSFLDGTRGDITLLAIKSTLDGVTAIVFAATLGWGVILSAVSVLVVQGSLTLFAFLIHAGLSDLEIAELTAAGGIAVLGIAVGLLELKSIKVANFLPALVVAPLLAGILHAMGAL